jgi:hypothetical protein
MKEKQVYFGFNGASYHRNAIESQEGYNSLYLCFSVA